MAGREIGRSQQQQQAGSAAAQAELLTVWVEEFLTRLDAGFQVETEGFVARAPAHLRRELRARCRDMLFLRTVLPGAPTRRPLPWLAFESRARPGSGASRPRPTGG